MLTFVQIRELRLHHHHLQESQKIILIDIVCCYECTVRVFGVVHYY